MFKEYKQIIELILTVILAILIGWAIYTVWSWHNAALVNAATVQQQAATGEAAGEVVVGLKSATADTAKTEETVRQARSSYATQYAKVLSTDASAASWNDAHVPVSLRDTARARRTARDGPADPSAGSSRSH
jgi:uncharacterized membrane protein YraQ (UPF0718 family)